ncbi:hypothetical protein V1477_006070 [Vespula maculifrons]|uniref:Uncharacterized protein n=1 Tax=Vespula maculifrons TaxID=7453 RepID=A0ABD2CLU7_VESMC
MKKKKKKEDYGPHRCAVFAILKEEQLWKIAFCLENSKYNINKKLNRKFQNRMRIRQKTIHVYSL